MTVKETIKMLLNSPMDAKVILSVQDKETADYRSAELSLSYEDETDDVLEVIMVASAKEG